MTQAMMQGLDEAQLQVDTLLKEFEDEYESSLNCTCCFLF